MTRYWSVIYPQGNEDNPSTLCVASSAVPAHLAHGDYLGSCGTSPCSGVQNLITPGYTGTAIETGDVGLTIFTNPADMEVTFNLNGFEEEAVVLTLFDYAGKTIWQATMEKGQHELKLDISNSTFINGIYFVKMSSGSDILTTRFVISK